jgi:hypothetical protein
MTTPGKPDRQYRRLPADDPPPPDAEGAPSFSRGWIRLRSPWRHPLELIRFLRLWRRLKRELDAAPGLRSFEYRLRLRPLMVGMHVVWDCHRDELRFAESSIHAAVASWSARSPLTPALRLEHFAASGDRLVRLGGFWLFEHEADLPSDAELPLHAARGA